MDSFDCDQLSSKCEKSFLTMITIYISIYPFTTQNKSRNIYPGI